MLADLPFSAVTREDVEALVSAGTPESHRLDFKATIDLSNRDAQVELLRDITAMANADGGLLVFGIGEGSGEQAGLAASVTGISGDAALLQERIEGLLRTSVEERINGVLQRSIPVGNKRFVHLVKVPASPLAPHMIANILTTRPRFFVRANTSNEPMTIGQIKDATLKRSGAVDRAVARIEGRMEILRTNASARPRPYYLTDGQTLQTDQAVLHFVPLYPPVGGWRYEEAEVRAVLEAVPAFGYQQAFPLRFTQHGAFGESRGIRHVGFLRDGSLEFQQFEVLLLPGPEAKPVFVASELEDSLFRAFRSARQLGEDGFLQLPAVVQLHLTGVHGSKFWPTRGHHSFDEPLSDSGEVRTDAFVLNTWDETPALLRDMLNHVWQAWGHPVCRHYDANGSLMFFNDYGQPRQMSD